MCARWWGGRVLRRTDAWWCCACREDGSTCIRLSIMTADGRISPPPSHQWGEMLGACVCVRVVFTTVCLFVYLYFCGSDAPRCAQCGWRRVSERLRSFVCLWYGWPLGLLCDVRLTQDGGAAMKNNTSASFKPHSRPAWHRGARRTLFILWENYINSVLQKHIEVYSGPYILIWKQQQNI